jgi:hypothetical protein
LSQVAPELGTIAMPGPATVQGGEEEQLERHCQPVLSLAKCCIHCPASQDELDDTDEDELLKLSELEEDELLEKEELQLEKDELQELEDEKDDELDEKLDDDELEKELEDDEKEELELEKELEQLEHEDELEDEGCTTSTSISENLSPSEPGI